VEIGGHLLSFALIFLERGRADPRFCRVAEEIETKPGFRAAGCAIKVVCLNHPENINFWNHCHFENHYELSSFHGTHCRGRVAVSGHCFDFG
jgi:hypothetical protein